MSNLDGKRQSKFHDTWKAIVKNVKYGLSYQRAAEAEGVSYQALYQWITRAKKAAFGDEEYVEFYTKLRRADARTERKMAKAIVDAAEFDWKAAKAWLESRNPADWGKRTEVEDKWEVAIRDLGLEPEDVLHEVVSIVTEKYGELGESDSGGGGQGSDESDPGVEPA